MVWEEEEEEEKEEEEEEEEEKKEEEEEKKDVVVVMVVVVMVILDRVASRRVRLWWDNPGRLQPNVCVAEAPRPGVNGLISAAGEEHTNVYSAG